MPGRLLGVVSAVGLTLAAGGGSSKTYNSADVTFAQSMILHHQQAIEMAAMTTAQAQRPEIKNLAARIQTAQEPENQQMADWLQSWQQPATTTAGGHGDMDHGSGMGGMMSGSDMTQLGSLNGAAFDSMFLTMMIAHHQGAVTMAQTEQATGKFADAKQLAAQSSALSKRRSPRCSSSSAAEPRRLSSAPAGSAAPNQTSSQRSTRPDRTDQVPASER
jgi:uncharacterized protein (DUF305 family)